MHARKTAMEVGKTAIACVARKTAMVCIVRKTGTARAIRKTSVACVARKTALARLVRESVIACVVNKTAMARVARKTALACVVRKSAMMCVVRKTAMTSVARKTAMTSVARKTAMTSVACTPAGSLDRDALIYAEAPAPAPTKLLDLYQGCYKVAFDDALSLRRAIFRSSSPCHQFEKCLSARHLLFGCQRKEQRTRRRVWPQRVPTVF